MLFTQDDRLKENDRATLVGVDEYKKYFDYLSDVFKRILQVCKFDENISEEGFLLEPFLFRLIKSFECFRMKYTFDPNFKMRIDQSDSSYPNAYEFNTLFDDIARRDTKLEELKSRGILIGDLIKSIYGHREDLSRLQFDLATRTYYEYLADPSKIFFPFTEGELILVSQSQGDNGRFVYTYRWGIFEDTLSIPMVFELTFETFKHEQFEDRESEVFKKFLYDINFLTKGLSPLADIATTLDSMNDDIYPKSLKRLVVGPLYGCYSTSDTKISKIVHGIDSTNAFALEVQSESVRSVEEKKRKKGLFVTEEKLFSQVFDISRTSSDTMIRKTTEFRQLLFVPHDVAQQLMAMPEVVRDMNEYTIVSLQKNNQ